MFNFSYRALVARQLEKKGGEIFMLASQLSRQGCASKDLHTSAHSTQSSSSHQIKGLYKSKEFEEGKL
jgi:hypothetical protein